ncbi:MAG: bifunctional nicotinamidase/pyrazinamidase [Treponema sp.]|jgi:nicotinamidase/pyrazinamidase|nr:bifunctional nicotinamidase/pyrazinamidase [Treponema sp.]
MDIDIKKTLLLIIDVQNDFCPGGALAVKDGNCVVSPLNALSGAFASKGGRVAATQDWHPAGHVSFASSHVNKRTGDCVDTPLVKDQMLWPDHCVQRTNGAAFYDGLDLKPVSLIIRKGFREDLDSYSAFFENDRKTATGLEGWIKSLNINTVIMGGLATDYCVFYSAMDCKILGMNTIIASDAVKGAGIPENSVEDAVTAMKNAGIEFFPSNEILDRF